MKKALNIVLGLLLLVTLLLAAYMVFDSTGMTINGKLYDHAAESSSLNIIWTYILLGFAILATIGSAVWGMIQKPAGIMRSLLSLGLIVVIVVAAYFLANSHHFEVPNLADGGFFPRPETVLSDASILVSYVVLCGAILVAIYSAIRKAIK